MHPFRTAVLIVTLLCSGSLCAAAVTVWFEPPAQTRNVGEAFFVDILASMSEPVLGWGLDLAWEPSILGAQGAPVIGASWSQVVTPDGDGLAGLAFPLGVQGSEVLLARVALVALAVGETNLLLSITPDDPTEGFLLDPVGSASPSFQPAQVTVTPEPATAALLVLLGFVGARRRTRGC